jgi:PAS fold
MRRRVPRMCHRTGTATWRTCAGSCGDTPDFVRVFGEAPAPFLLLGPDLVIVHANRARPEATSATLEDTVGRRLFDVFPMNPDDPAADGLRNLRASLERVVSSGQPETMAIQKYDIPMPDGTYEERYWSPPNVPILDDDGNVVFVSTGPTASPNTSASDPSAAQPQIPQRARANACSRSSPTSTRALESWRRSTPGCQMPTSAHAGRRGRSHA